jgi:hypothetical protein
MGVKKNNEQSAGAVESTTSADSNFSRYDNRLEWIAIFISTLAFAVAGAQYLLQRDERLAADRSALLSAQISLGSENVTEMTGSYPEFEKAMIGYLHGNVDQLAQVKLRHSALVSRNFQIMPSKLSAHVNTYFLQTQKMSIACILADPPLSANSQILAELRDGYLQAHKTAATVSECHSQLAKNEQRFNAYLDDFRSMLGMEELEINVRASRLRATTAKEFQ